jgi:cell division protein ZipA
LDIKDIILVGGGLLIVAVIVHGFWIAWCARRDPLRMDLVTDLPPADSGDEMLRLRAELPNGGARVVSRDDGWPEQVDLPLETGSEGAGHRSAASRARRAGDPAPVARRSEPEVRPRSRTEPRLGADAESSPTAAAHAEPAVARQQRSEAAAPDRTVPRPKVTDVILPERPVGKEHRTALADASLSRQAARQLNKLADKVRPEKNPVRSPEDTTRPGARPADRPAAKKRQSGPEPRKAEPAVEELIMISVLAHKGAPFVGPGLVEALRSRGLRYGDMNIFHRVDPMTRATLYSVANVVEPGTFDMADLDNFRSPGVCFFLQLPGPENPMEVFEDMVRVAREVAARAGGELKDEQRSVMTGQTVEHYRQRISDFCRRRMSMRA